MHVHAEPVAGAVHVERLVRPVAISWAGSPDRRPSATRPGQPRDDRLWIWSERRARLDRVDRGLLRVEHHLVEPALDLGEMRADRERPRDVRRVAVDLAAGIDEQELPAAIADVVLDVVEDRRVRARADDAAVPGPRAAAAAERLVEQRLDLALAAPGRAVRIAALCASAVISAARRRTSTSSGDLISRISCNVTRASHRRTGARRPRRSAARRRPSRRATVASISGSRPNG